LIRAVAGGIPYITAEATLHVYRLENAPRLINATQQRKNKVFKQFQKNVNGELDWLLTKVDEIIQQPTKGNSNPKSSKPSSQQQTHSSHQKHTDRNSKTIPKPMKNNQPK